MRHVLPTPFAVAIRVLLVTIGIAGALYSLAGAWMTADFSFFAQTKSAVAEYQMRLVLWLIAAAGCVLFAVWQSVLLRRETR